MSAPMALEDTDWLHDAVATIVGISLVQQLFTAEDLAREMRKPPNDKMPGQAFAAARNAGHIEGVGYTTSSSKTRKHGVTRVWRRKITKEFAA
jgi:hypothetical protein